jgi:expansin (peptidoglycan-binding protein)
VQTNKLSDSAGQQTQMMVRRVGPTTTYRGRIDFISGKVYLQFNKGVNGSWSTLGQRFWVRGLAHQPNTEIWVRLQVLGANPTTLRMKAWLAGQPQPAAWQIEVADGESALQQAGSVGLRAFLPGATTSSPLTFSFDDLAVDSIGGEPIGEQRAGEGTYYWEANGAGNCLFDATPDNLMVGAMNQADYNMAALCGAYVHIQGPRGAVDVRIVDRCPECLPGDIDLSPQAFARIAPIEWGRVPITWQLISPELEGPIAYHFKDGSNQWWTAVQVRNHRVPIARFEYLAPNGQFVEVARTEWNYFVKANGMGPGPYTFRVTDIFGRTLTDSNIPHIENGTVQGSAQFPPPP